MKKRSRWNVLEPQFSLKSLRSVKKHQNGNKYFKRKINQNPEFRIFDTTVFNERVL